MDLNWYAVLVAVIALLLWIIDRKTKQLIELPGPRPLPFVGNILHLTNIKEVLPKFLMFMRTYGDNYKLKFGNKTFIQICDAELVKKVVNSNNFNEKSEFYSFLHSWLGTGLLTSSGQKWQNHRKIITPTFHFQILENFIPTFATKSDILVEKLSAFCGKGDFDISQHILLCTLDIICETAMGTSMNIQNDSSSPYVKAVHNMREIFMRRTLSPVKQFQIFYQFSKDYKLEKESLDILHSTTMNVIRKRKELLDNTVDTVPDRKTAFLDTLLNNGLDLEDIKNEVDTFMFEGHDTTGSGLYFILYCLSIYPNIQEMVYEEQQCIYGKTSNKTTLQNLLSMNYLEKVIKESMRLYPPVPTFARKIINDYHYNSNVLAKGGTAAIFSFGIHRNSRYFPNPEEFDPERFTVENSMTRPQYAYIPFSAGPRNCIGQKFAMLEMKVVISKLVRNYKFLPCPGFKPVLIPDIVLKSDNGIRLKIVKRE